MAILFKLNQYNQQRQHEKARWIFPIELAMYATALKNQGNEVIWDGVDNGLFDKVITSESQIDISFLELPHADREFTNAKNKKWQQNGNFKYNPATYILSSNTCWYKKCSFCLETKMNKPYEVREVDDVISEIEECKRMGFREVFDDSATFPTGLWLDNFINRVRFRRIIWGCNFRIIDYDFKQMKLSGCRMLLFGLESANQKTLDRIQKGTRVEDVKYIIKAAKAGLEPHIAVMFGYPWESDEDALKTLRLVHWLLKKGYAKTAQASFYRPDYAGNRQEEPKLSHRHFTRRIYDVAYSPEFWFRKITEIKDTNDLKYLWRQIKVGLKKG